MKPASYFNGPEFLDPILQLELLRDYMSKKIDAYPGQYKSRGKYIRRYKSLNVPESIEYAKHHATHCFYCDRKFKTNTTVPDKTIDHFYASKNRRHRDKLVIACFSCNHNKCDTDPVEFRRIADSRWWLPTGAHNRQQAKNIVRGINEVLSTEKNHYYRSKPIYVEKEKHREDRSQGQYIEASGMDMAGGSAEVWIQ